MFSAKLFNQITVVLAVIFFLSATISTISDIQQEYSIRVEFSELLQEVNVFNSEHSNYLNQDNVTPVVDDENAYQTGKEALLDAFSNYTDANSYYNEVYSRLSFPGLKFPFEVDLWMKNIQYPDGDFVQVMVAKEVGTFFGGNGADMILFYDESEEIVYSSLKWGVRLVDGEWTAGSNDRSWKQQTLQEYLDFYGAMPGTSIYDIKNHTLVEETFFKTVRNSQNEIKEYHVQYKLNPILSTKLYFNFLNYALSFVQDDFVRSINFKELTVSAIIDANGQFKTVKYTEKYGFSVTVKQLGGISLSATANSNMNYIFAFINEPIPYEKPTVVLPK